MAWYFNHVNFHRAKITLPKCLQDNLPRDHIIDIIDAIQLEKAVCIIAPSGYGKTQAALQWLEHHDYRCVYYCPDEADNRLEVLVEGITAAILTTVDPQTIDADVLDDLIADKTPQTLLHRVAMCVRNIPGNYVFMIKNLHRIEDLNTLEQLKVFIQSILGYWKVIIIDIKQLPPVFNHMIITGHIYPITVSDLRLNIEETGAFLRQGGFEVSSAGVQNIWSQTQGWLAALNAIIKTSIEAHHLHYGTMAREIIEDYFESGIWRHLDDSMRVFLMKTSIADILSPSLCHSLTDTATPKSVLNKLYNNGIFINLDENGKYQYHPIFRSFLLHKLENSNLDEESLYINYGWWLYSQKDYVRAFHYFFKFKFMYGINWMLHRLNPTILPYDALLEISQEILSFNPYELKQYPNIVEKIALIEYLTGNLDRMRDLKNIFLDWAKPGALSLDVDEYSELFWESGWLVLLDPEENLCEEYIRNFIHFREYAYKMEELHEAKMAALGFPSIFRGARDFSEIADTIKPFMKQVDNGNQDLIRSEYALMETRLVLAEYLYESDALLDAMEQIRIIMPKASDHTHAKLYFCCIALLVKIMRAQGDSKEVGDFSNMLEQKIQEKKSYFLLPNYHAFLQRNYLADGNTGFLDAFYTENSPLDGNNYFYLLYRKIAYVRGLLSLKKNHSALIILESLTLLCKKYKRVLDLIEVYVLKSIALYHLKDPINAVNNMQKAYDIAKSYGYIRVIADDADELMPVLNLLQNHNNEIFLKQIIISAKKTAHGCDFMPTKNPYVDLTKTELIILNLLKNNFTYEEISVEQGIKLTTVKKHTQSIYGKLGVRNKSAAVYAAIRRGILKN